MKKLKRIMGIILSVIMILSMFAACNSGNKTGDVKDTQTTQAATTAPAVTVEDNKPVTLRFMWWGSDTRHNSTLAMIEAYKTARPNVTIEAEYSGYDGYQDKLTTQLASATAADLMQVSYSWVSDLQKKGSFFVDLSKYTQLMDISMFSDTIIKSYCTEGDAIVAVPAGMSGYAFMVNKNTLAKAGVAIGGKWTWDDILEAAGKVHALGKDYYFLNDGDKGILYTNYLIPYIQGRIGTNLVKEDYTLAFTRDNLVEALTYIKSLNDNNAWQPVTEITEATDAASNPRWIEGKVAASLGQYVSSFLGDVQAMADSAGDVEIYPVLKDGKDSAIATQPSMLLCVNARSEKSEEAIKFLNYMFTDEAAIKALGTCRGISASKKGMEVATANNLIDPMVSKCLKLAVDNASAIPFSSINEDSELATAAMDVIEMLLFNKLTPETAADEIITRFTTRLTEMKTAQ